MHYSIAQCSISQEFFVNIAQFFYTRMNSTSVQSLVFSYQRIHKNITVVVSTREQTGQYPPQHIDTIYVYIAMKVFIFVSF